MKDIKPQTDAQKIDITVNTNSFLGSQYSQLVGVSVTEFGTTLEFVYLNPMIKDKASVVSRITLPVKVAKDLADKINSTIEKYESATSKKA